MAEAREITEEKIESSKVEIVEQEHSLPLRILRWFVIHFFKIIEGIIRLCIAVYYGIKTVAVLLFHYFIWPYPVFFRWRK